MVSSLVIANDGVPPELVDSKSTLSKLYDGKLTDEGECIVEFVVLSDPRPNQSPSGPNSWVCSKSSNLLWSSACID